MAPKMTPVLVNENELMVWFDFQSSLDAFFEDLAQDLSTKEYSVICIQEFFHC